VEWSRLRSTDEPDIQRRRHWCELSNLQPTNQVKAAANGSPWAGYGADSPLTFAGRQIRHSCNGRVGSTTTGLPTRSVEWRLKTNIPFLVVSYRATAGKIWGVVSDMGGNFCSGREQRSALWQCKTRRAIAAAVVTYSAGARRSRSGWGGPGLLRYFGPPNRPPQKV